MAEKKSPATAATTAAEAAAAADTRRSFAVDRAFVHDGVYYTGSDRHDIGDLPKDVIADRIERGYIREFNTYAPAPAAPGTVNAET